MADPDARTDPVDKAYVEAEALLSDEAARAARRARVLAAAAREPASPDADAADSRPRGAWRRGGWLAAACVAIFCGFLAARIYKPVVEPPPAAVPASAASESVAATAPKAPDLAAPEPPRARLPQPVQPRTSPALSTPALAPAPENLAAPPPAPPPPPPPAPLAVPLAAGPPPAAVSRKSSVGEVVVTGSRIQRGDFEASEPIVASPASPEEGPADLRAAAEDGRTRDIRRLVSQGIPVDAADAEGNTPLMKSIQAGRTEAAALLHRYGARLDLRNRAGVSARDMARETRNPALDEALGLDPDGDGPPRSPLGSR